MSGSKLPVSVIIVSYNTCALTRKALWALFASRQLPAQVIVVDNASTDDTVKMVHDEFPQVELMVNTENAGFAKANNQAIREKANQPYIWLLNSDTETGAQTLEQLVDFMEAHPRVGALGPQLVYPDRRWQSVGGFFPAPLNVLLYFLPLGFLAPKQWRYRWRTLALYPQPLPLQGRTIDYVTGAALFLRQQALNEVGLLGEEYFMYFEETDLCWRLQRSGWGVMVIDTEPVMHVYGGSFKKAHDQRRLRLFLESLVIFVRKYYHGWRHSVILAEIFLFSRLSIWLKQLWRL